MYDFLVVGAGLFGATFVQRATFAGLKCLVVDKRDKIGGNCATYEAENIIVHEHGPHIFHTDNSAIWNYVQKFATFQQFMLRPKAVFNDKFYSLPISLETLNQLYGVTNPADAQRLITSLQIPCENPRNLEEWILSQVGHEIYETLFYGYTTKQWGVEPSKLPASIIKRLPIRYTWDNNYFNDRFQGIPAEGYSHMINNMLCGSEVRLNIDFLQEKHTLEKLCDKIIYTGKIDEYFGYVHGELEYRGLDIEFMTLDVEDHQGNVMINHTDKNVPYTRVVEHKHFNPYKKSNKTIISREYPKSATNTDTPYYPIPTIKNIERYEKYKSLLSHEKKLFMGGRLGSYRYMDMHQVIAAANTLAKKLLIPGIF